MIEQIQTPVRAPADPGRGRGRIGWSIARGLLASGRTGRTLFWLLISLFIIVPCAFFLVIAVSPKLFDAGSQWFTLSFLKETFTGLTAVSLVNSVWVSCAAAGLGLVVGLPIAWLAARTSLPGRRLVAGSMWLVLLLPSWLPAIGWERLVQPDGVLYRLGIGTAWETHLIMGPFGVVLLLGLRSVPFAYLAVTAALNGLGQEFEDAARTHGAGELTAWARAVLPVVSRPIVMAWLLTFCGTFLELPLSQLLYAPSNPPASISIQDNLSVYHFGIGMAQSVLAVGIALAAVAIVLGGYRLIAPHGWRRIGGVSRG